MKWSSESVLLMILIAALSDFRSKAEINRLNRYVTPNRTVRCFNDQVPCQTLEQYATQPEMYFTNNTYLYFQPGNHQLKSSLAIKTEKSTKCNGGLPDNNMIINNIFLGSPIYQHSLGKLLDYLVQQVGAYIKTRARRAHGAARA